MPFSIFTTESIPILKALKMIKEHSLRNSAILSGSLSAINSVKNVYNLFDVDLQITFTISKITTTTLNYFRYSNILTRKTTNKLI